MRVEINISKKHLWGIVAILLLFIAAVFVVAQSGTDPVPNPGHSAASGLGDRETLIVRGIFSYPFSSSSGVTCTALPSNFSGYNTCLATFDELCVDLGYSGGAAIDWDGSTMHGFCFLKNFFEEGRGVFINKAGTYCQSWPC